MKDGSEVLEEKDNFGEIQEGRIRNVFSDVDDFIVTLEQDKCVKPEVPQGDLLNLRLKLIEEEWNEIKEAVENDQIDGLIDGCLDLIYVTAGFILAAGVPADDAQRLWEMIHKANMEKIGGPRDENGKILKPAGWKHPDILGELKKISENISS